MTQETGSIGRLDIASDAARQAEQDMGWLVALLADDDAIGAAPDLALVEELVARAGGAGLDVTLRLEGEREGYQVDVVQGAYRLVQDGVTSAARYAAGPSVGGWRVAARLPRHATADVA